MSVGAEDDDASVEERPSERADGRRRSKRSRRVAGPELEDEAGLESQRRVHSAGLFSFCRRRCSCFFLYLGYSRVKARRRDVGTIRDEERFATEAQARRSRDAEHEEDRTDGGDECAGLYIAALSLAPPLHVHHQYTEAMITARGRLGGQARAGVRPTRERRPGLIERRCKTDGPASRAHAYMRFRIARCGT